MSLSLLPYRYRLLLIFSIIALCPAKAVAQWSFLGYPSDDGSLTGAIAGTHTGTIWLVNDWAGVHKYDGTSWTSVGVSTFPVGNIFLETIAVDTSGMPYVAFQDSSHTCKITVLKLTDTSWAPVGTAGFSVDTAKYISLVIDRNNTPWVAFQDKSNGNKATVMKYNGTAWVTVGTAGFSARSAFDISLAVDSLGTPYIAMCDTSDFSGAHATVMKYNGTSWATVGDLSFLGDQLACTVIAIDTGGMPLVSFINLALYTPAAPVQTMYYDAAAGQWKQLGYSYPGYQMGTNVPFPSESQTSVYMTISKGGTPYVYFSDYWESREIVMSYNGTGWVSQGPIEFGGMTRPLGLCIDDTGNVYAGTTSISSISLGVTNVLKLKASTSTTLQGNLVACVGDTVVLTEMVAGGTWYDDGPCYCITKIPSGLTMKLVRTAPIGAITTEIMEYVITSYATAAQVTILPYPDSITIGSKAICADFATTISDTVAGGLWSSSPAGVVSVTSTDTVIALSPGTATRYYMLAGTGNGCGSTSTVVTVNPIPGFISGDTRICSGDTVTYSDSLSGGIWVSDASVLTVDSASGGATGITAGTADISYIMPTGCGVTAVVTVQPLPAAISGVGRLCPGAMVSLSDTLTGGAWSGGAVITATVNAATGTVTGINSGTADVTYTAPGGCTAIIIITVSPQPSAIHGIDTLCPGTITALSDGVTGGTWTSGTTAIATVNAMTGMVAGIASGTAEITYTSADGCHVTQIVTVNNCVNLEITQLGGNDDAFSVFPNPALAELIVQSQGVPVKRITITDLLGRSLLFWQSPQGYTDAHMDITAIPPGVYFIRINDAWVHKFLKE